MIVWRRETAEREQLFDVDSHRVGEQTKIKKI